jgi:hypothetical protein
MWWIGAAYSMLSFTVALSLFFAAVSPLAAQPRGFVVPRPNPSVSNGDQLAPSQMNQPMPPAVSEPPGSPARSKSQPVRPATADATAESPATARKPVQPNGSGTVIACSGPFAQDSGMLALAMTFGSGNMIFTQEKVEGSEVGATVLYPEDPKRRLEVWWSNPNRTGLYLIDIAGKSIWTGPGGLRLALTLPELEKLNHKPFKLKGLDKDGVATVSDWDGGALATLPGGCKASVSFHADPKSSKDAVSAVSEDHEFSSADSTIHAAKLTVSEVLIGY